jgi:hypothetical protein
MCMLDISSETYSLSLQLFDVIFFQECIVLESFLSLNSYVIVILISNVSLIYIYISPTSGGHSVSIVC